MTFYCTNCRAEVAESAVVCPRCGDDLIASLWTEEGVRGSGKDAKRDNAVLACRQRAEQIDSVS